MSKYIQSLILLDGPKGAGKSTVGHLLEKSIPESVYLSLDEERKALPDRSKSRKELNKEAFEIIFKKATENIKQGKSPIIDCGLIAERFERLSDLARTENIQLLPCLLKAPYETLLNRVRERDASRGNPTDEERFKEVYDAIFNKDLSLLKSFDSEKDSPDMIAKKILEDISSNPQ